MALPAVTEETADAAPPEAPLPALVEAAPALVAADAAAAPRDDGEHWTPATKKGIEVPQDRPCEAAAKRRKMQDASSPAPAPVIVSASERFQELSVHDEAQSQPRKRLRKKGPAPEHWIEAQLDQRALSPLPPAPEFLSAGASNASCTGVPSRKGLPVADAAGSWLSTSAPRGGGGTSGLSPGQLRTEESTGTGNKERPWVRTGNRYPVVGPSAPASRREC